MTKLDEFWNDNPRFRHWAMWMMFFAERKDGAVKFYCLDCNEVSRILSQEHKSHKNVRLFRSGDKSWTIWGWDSSIGYTQSPFRIFHRVDPPPDVLHIRAYRVEVGRDTAIG